MITLKLTNEQYGLLFDVRRSIRYHDLRRSFFERAHQITGALTVLLAGSVLFDIARPGNNPWWLTSLAVIAAVLSAWDIIVGYSRKAGLHQELKVRFANLEIKMLSSDLSEDDWNLYQVERLMIEKDEPPIYRILDLVCHNQLMKAYGFDQKDRTDDFAKINKWQYLTRHIFLWPHLVEN